MWNTRYHIHTLSSFILIKLQAGQVQRRTQLIVLTYARCRCGVHELMNSGGYGEIFGTMQLHTWRYNLCNHCTRKHYSTQRLWCRYMRGVKCHGYTCADSGNYMSWGDLQSISASQCSRKLPL